MCDVKLFVGLGASHEAVALNYQMLPWKSESFKWRSILPDIGAFARNNAFIHEYIGYYGYKWFRR